MGERKKQRRETSTSKTRLQTTTETDTILDPWFQTGTKIHIVQPEIELDTFCSFKNQKYK